VERRKVRMLLVILPRARAQEVAVLPLVLVRVKWVV
jgi:hypothetical protein